MEKYPNCTRCGSEHVYEDGTMYICPECSFEWVKGESSQDIEQVPVVRDANGNLLQDGDSVVVVKDLKVKGASSVLKVGTKAKEIHLVEEVDGHNIEAKIKGFGSIMLKSKFVKKSN